jgi:hypothetical protein
MRFLDWNAGESGQAQPEGGLGGGSPLEWSTSLAQGQRQPFVWDTGYGVADENNFGKHYWMLDVDMDCEQAFDDGQGHRWFEFKTFVAKTPGWEDNIAQNSTPPAPYSSTNHMGQCGMVNVFVANFPNLPNGLDPNSAQFLSPSYSYLAPVDERNATSDALTKTPCRVPNTEKRCLGNLAQTCQTVGTAKFFRTVEDCNSSSAGGNYVKMCQKSAGQCCSPTNGNTCQ